ncbi:MAG: aldo/keto reductase [Propionibacteriaceae bacterium]|nr:aldo/keto reductase [Propionibacteriaceae bacterium]
MKTYAMPHTTLTVPAVIAGMMRIGELDDAAIRTLVRTALDNGITYFDHADIYGRNHHCERRFAEALRMSPQERSGIIIQTKCGIQPGLEGTFYDFSREHILAAVDESLAALRTDYLDVLLLHRPDTLVEPDEVAAAFDELERAGKVRHFGVSNHTPGQIALLARSVRQPLVVNQMQLSITHSSLLAQGIAANMGAEDQSVSRDLGLIDFARLNGITLQAWSPFQSGFFTGVFLGDPQYAGLNAVLNRLASKYGVTPMGIATAWITRHPANIQVVLGTTQPGRVAEAAAGADIPLTRSEWYELFRVAGHIVP